MPRFSAMFLEVAKAYQLGVFLVPESVFHAGEAGAQGHDGDGMEHLFCFVAFLESVVWDTGAEVVDVVVADITRKPLQHFG